MDWELIVIDDEAINAFMSIAQASIDRRICLLKNPHNLGLPLTHNHGIDNASGNYVDFLDGDDIALLHSLQKQIDFLEAKPCIVVVGAPVQPVNAQGQVTRQRRYIPRDGTYCKASLLLGIYSITSTSGFTARAQVLRENRFDILIVFAEDYDFYIFLCKRHCLGNLPQILIQYRIHESNTTRTRCQELCEAALEGINWIQITVIKTQPIAHKLLIHQHIEWLDMASSMELLVELSDWLLRILSHNKCCAVYDTVALRQVTGERWHAVCENALRYGYRSAWLMFYRSLLCGTRALVGVESNAKLTARLLVQR